MTVLETVMWSILWAVQLSVQLLCKSLIYVCIIHARTGVFQRWTEDLYWRSGINMAQKFHKCFQFCNYCMSLIISGSSIGHCHLVALKDSNSDAGGTWGVRVNHLTQMYCPGPVVWSSVHVAAQLVSVLWMLAACKEMFYQAHRKQIIESGFRLKWVVLWVPSKCPCSGKRGEMCYVSYMPIKTAGIFNS